MARRASQTHPTDDIRNDWRCMERLKQGEDLALNELMDRWKAPLVSFCLRYTGNGTDAREIAQETFVKVYGARKRYRPEAAFSTWLFGIAANLCRMRARWKSRHPEVLEADQPDTALDSPTNAPAGGDPRVETDRHQLARDLDHAIRLLPHDLRVAFVLYELHGSSYREVSRVTGCSEKAVERRLARARANLRAALADTWGQ